MKIYRVMAGLTTGNINLLSPFGDYRDRAIAERTASSLATREDVREVHIYHVEEEDEEVEG